MVRFSNGWTIALALAIARLFEICSSNFETFLFLILGFHIPTVYWTKSLVFGWFYDTTDHMTFQKIIRTLLLDFSNSQHRLKIFIRLTRTFNFKLIILFNFIFSFRIAQNPGTNARSIKTVASSWPTPSGRRVTTSTRTRNTDSFNQVTNWSSCFCFVVTVGIRITYKGEF